MTDAELRVDLVALQCAADAARGAVGDAAAGFVGHGNNLVEAAPGWVGSSQAALAEVTARWEQRHAHHTRGGAGLWHGVVEAGNAHLANEEHSAQRFVALEAGTG
ncbi:MAG TPA: RNA 2'-phosphotransferase [Mycobacterium sp.]